jgi:hypothetical protein
MPGNPIRPWIAVNEYMQDEYRETLVDLALRHLPHASQDLRVFAKREISQAVTISAVLSLILSRPFELSPTYTGQRLF